MVVAEPEIHVVRITDQTDYILIGSDGIFDKLETEDCCKIVQQEAQNTASRLAKRKEITFE